MQPKPAVFYFSLFRYFRLEVAANQLLLETPALSNVFTTPSNRTCKVRHMCTFFVSYQAYVIREVADPLRFTHVSPSS